MKIRSYSLFSTSASISALVCLFGHAQAQQVGTYSGTSADGTNISVTIGVDGATNALQVTAFGLGLADTCNPGGFTFNTGWGLGGDGTDLSGNTGTYTSSFGYLYVLAHLKFSGNNLTGDITNATPTFVAPATAGTEPKKAAYCSSKKQKFNATLNAPAATPSGRMQGFTYGGQIKR